MLLENQRQIPSIIAFLKKSFRGHEKGITKVFYDLENIFSDESKPINIKEFLSGIKIKL